MAKTDTKWVEIFTDGCCLGNPGPGAFGAILRYNQHEKIVSDTDPNTTNNRMELKAIILALQALKHPCRVSIYTDSQYVMKGMTEWKQKWQAKDLKGLSNRDLWLELFELQEKQLDVIVNWVRGHNGHTENEKIDAHVNREARKLQQRLKNEDAIKSAQR